jgi:peptidoglycan hydrolase-like protein with peptidoglycan-binding domain
MTIKKYEVIESSRDRIVLQLAGKSQKSTTVKYLEIPDVLFNHNSSVPCIDNKDTLVFGIVSARLFANDNPDLELVIYGHTDSSGETEFNKKLSEERAKAIKALLDNNRDTYVDICNNCHKVEDYQTILSALTTLYGWSCDPGAIDNEDGPNTQAAVSSFQADYSTYYKKSIEDAPGVVGPQTWGAFFDVITEQIDLIVKSEIGDTKPVITYGKGGNGVLGCGEEFAQNAFAREGRRSKKDRRVEITFVNPADPIDETPYTGPIVFEPLEIKVDRPPIEKKPEIPRIKDFEMWCSHEDKGKKRKVTSSKPLEIVPSTVSDKITVRALPAASGLTVHWKCADLIDETNMADQNSFKVYGFETQVKDAFMTLVMGDLKNVLPPKKLTVTATANGKSISNKLHVYPYKKTSYEVDFSKVFGWIKDANKKLNGWLGIGDKSPFKFEMLIGKITFEGGYEEDKKSNLAFYKFSLKGGFNPLFGASFKCYPPVPGTAILPPAIQKYIACITFIISIKGGVALTIGVERSGPSALSGIGEATGSIAIGGGLAVKVANGKVLEANLLATSGLKLNYKLDCQYDFSKEKFTPKDSLKLTWDGLKGEMNFKLFDGVYSKSSKVIIFEPRDLWETDKQLLFK